MKIYPEFSPVNFTPNHSILSSVKEHRELNGITPIFRIVRQVVRAKVKTTYPENWTYFNNK